MEGTLHLAPVYPPSTATDLAAAKLLVQLSGSSASSSAAAAATAEDRASSSSSSSSSPGSGNAKRQRPEIKILPDNEEEDEETGPWQRTRRYRPIALLYASTRPLHDRDRDNKREADEG